MELYSDCVNCVIKNVLQCAREIGVKERDMVRLVGQICRDLGPEISQTSCSPILTEIAYNALMEISGLADPFEKEKRAMDEAMILLEEGFFELSSSREDPIEGALILSGVANLMDLGAFKTVDPEEVGRIMERELDLRRLPRLQYAAFLDLIDRNGELLILGDNCGEIVLDKVVIRQMRRRWPNLSVTYGVRGKATLNDATEVEAKRVGMDDVARVISTGVGTPGFVRDMASPEFKSLYERAPVILAKGVGNFEAAEFGDERLFHLFIIKCKTLSDLLKRPERDLVFMSGRGSLL